MTTRDDTPAARTPERVRTAASVLLLALVALSPWPFGSANPSGQFAVALALLVLAALWAAHAALTRRLVYRTDGVSVCLLGLVIVTALQLVPLPAGVARAVSPATVEWRHALLPAAPELLPGESEADVPRPGAWVRLTLVPFATEDLLVQFLAPFLVYAAARNFAGGGPGLRRLAWVGFAAGTALAVVALAQYLSGERERIYWRYDAGAPVFGPFVNRNHFAFQVHLFAGLGVGLFLAVARRDGVLSPGALGLLGGLGVMVAAVGFSQSRGGAIALAAAAVITGGLARAARGEGESGERRLGWALVAGVGLVAVALSVWFGWGTVLDRLASVWRGEADNRSHLWRRTWSLVEQFPLTGVGGGAYSAAEPTTRASYEGSFVSTSAHNETLEALIEGGLPRFALTVGLAVAAVGAVARRYRRTRDPLLLGCVFGLAAVAVHSLGDFGIHVPSVALAAAVVAAYGAGAPETGGRRQETADAGRPAAGASAHHPAFAALFVLAALVVVLADWRAFTVDRLRTAAAFAEGPEDSARLLEAAARVRSNDADTWELLASAHLFAAAEKGNASLAAAVGFAAFGDDVLPGADPDGHVAQALKAARAGRNARPLDPGPHLRLGTFADRLARAEPWRVHLDRAKRVAPSEPDVWFVAGKTAAARGDWPTALADWREALVRSPRRLPAVARAAAGRVPPEQLREKTLPADPAVWFAVTPQLFPDASDPARARWLRAVVDRCRHAPPEDPAGFIAWASALEDLGEPDEALRVWRRAVERHPDDESLRDRLAARLESDERYDEALPHLEWLVGRRPESAAYRDRLAAARHALALKAEIDRP